MPDRRTVLNVLGWVLTIVLFAAAATFIAVAQMEGW